MTDQEARDEGCICTPAIAGISDGPSVDCTRHGEARDDEREALARAIDAYGVTDLPYASRHFTAGFLAGYRKSPAPEVTDEMVERAARVFYESQTGSDRLPGSFYRDAWLRMARFALEAALNPKEEK